MRPSIRIKKWNHIKGIKTKPWLVQVKLFFKTGHFLDFFKVLDIITIMSESFLEKNK